MMRICGLAATCMLAASMVTAHAADVPTSYTVSDTALKAAVAGTNLTFTLYTDAGCTQQAHQQVVPIEMVAFVSRLKTFTPKNAPKGPKIDEMHETLTGVNAAGNLYLTVAGTGITPVGGTCQAQATVQPPSAVVKDANGLLVGNFGGGDSGFGPGIYTVLISVGGTTAAIGYSGLSYHFAGCVVFPAAGCVEPAFMSPTDFTALPYAPGVVYGGTLYTPSSGPAVPVTAVSASCGGGCSTTTGTVAVVPATATPFSFTRPFHVELP
jgi:hypothetical protein